MQAYLSAAERGAAEAALGSPGGAVLTIDLHAIAANFTLLVRLAAPAACAGVVKADAYGLGMAQVAPALAAAGCRHFFVAQVAEGQALRATLGEGPSIFVLHGFPDGAASSLLEADLVPVLNSPGQVAAWSALAAARRAPLPAVLQLDSGMGRLGVGPEDLSALTGLERLDVRLVMSHLACADDPAHPANARQLRVFRELAGRCSGVAASLAASCGIFLGREFHFDLVRPGAALYGLAPCAGANPMRPVVGLRAEVIQTRRIAAGEAVGYGLAWQAARPARIVTVAIGYADGFSRAPAAGRVAWFGDAALPVVGRVSMDSTILDASDLPEGALRAGDWVELIGPHADADALARASGTISLEILARLGRRLARRYE